jgi:hypothetical protein
MLRCELAEFMENSERKDCRAATVREWAEFVNA